LIAIIQVDWATRLRRWRVPQDVTRWTRSPSGRISPTRQYPLNQEPQHPAARTRSRPGGRERSGR
jgi:hypothetical protein